MSYESHSDLHLCIKWSGPLDPTPAQIIPPWAPGPFYESTLTSMKWSGPLYPTPARITPPPWALPFHESAPWPLVPARICLSTWTPRPFWTQLPWVLPCICPTHGAEGPLRGRGGCVSRLASFRPAVPAPCVVRSVWTTNNSSTGCIPNALFFSHVK